MPRANALPSWVEKPVSICLAVSQCFQLPRRHLAVRAHSTGQLTQLSAGECRDFCCSTGDDRLYQSVKVCVHIVLCLLPLVLENHKLSLKKLANLLSQKPQLFQHQGPLLVSFPHRCHVSKNSPMCLLQ